MRVMLVNWMMKVSSGLKLKRNTYFISIFYVDKYLSINHDITKNEFLLIGVTAMLIASKLEE